MKNLIILAFCLLSTTLVNVSNIYAGSYSLQIESNVPTYNYGTVKVVDQRIEVSLPLGNTFLSAMPSATLEYQNYQTGISRFYIPAADKDLLHSINLYIKVNGQTVCYIVSLSY